MNTHQPKYITYKGVRYERVNTLNEIIVEPSSNCCIITVLLEMGHLSVQKFEFKIGNPERIADDALSKAKHKQRERYGQFFPISEEFFSKEPIEIDQYSYYADIGEEGEFLAVCTKGKGKWSFLYDLAENDDYDGITDAASEREDLQPRHGQF